MEVKHVSAFILKKSHFTGLISTIRGFCPLPGQKTLFNFSFSLTPYAPHLSTLSTHKLLITVNMSWWKFTKIWQLMMVTAYSFVQHTVTHDYSVLTSIMKFNWKQTKTHSEKQKEVLELENTLFSTKNACKEWPIGFMICPLIFWMAHWNF